MHWNENENTNELYKLMHPTFFSLFDITYKWIYFFRKNIRKEIARIETGIFGNKKVINPPIAFSSTIDGNKRNNQRKMASGDNSKPQFATFVFVCFLSVFVK